MRVATDVGGTFTDYVLFDDDELIAYKALTTPNPAEGILDQLTEKDLHEFSHGTTVAVNTIIERTGAPVVFFTTRGFKDLINIGRQARSNVYSLMPKKPEIPVAKIIPVTERTTSDGKVLTNIYDHELAQAGVLHGDDDHVAVIGFINSYANPENERKAENIVGGRFPVVLTSHEIRREIREYERFCTSVIEGYCTTKVNDYLKELEPLCSQYFIMQSNGGKNYQEYMRAVNMIMSGPAGGVAATEALCKKLGIPNAIAYDMGGTSADVSAIVSGKPIYTDTVSITGIPIRTLAIDIESIGAGGGSIAWIDDGGALKVGPRSAGSEPGPACYSRGGFEFTVSDANMILGILGSSISKIELNIDKAKKASKTLCDELDMSTLELSQGVLRIVNNNMISAIKRISIGKGYDPRNFTLVAFGGAGPMHACALAEALGIKQIIVPPFAGAFSAFGILSAPVRFDYIRTILLPLEASAKVIPEVIDKFKRNLRIKLGSKSKHALSFESLDMRYSGQGHEINIPMCDDLAKAFHTRHQELFGFSMVDNPIEVVNVKLVLEFPMKELPLQTYPKQPPKMIGTRDVESNKNVNVYRKEFFGSKVEGPCIIEDETTTVYVPTGWKIELDELGVLKLECD